MKRTLAMRMISFAAALCLLLSLAACSGGSATVVAEGKVDNLQWVLDSEGCLSFTGTGAIPGAEYTLSMDTGLSETVYPEWYDHQDQITKVVIGSGIESISMNAFMYFPSLCVIDMSATVKRVNGYAVTGCAALERVIIRCASVDMEKYCIGFTGGTADSYLSEVTFVGAAGSAVKRYAEECGAKFSKL